MSDQFMRPRSRYLWPDTYLRRRDGYRIGCHVGLMVAATGLLGIVFKLTGAESEWLADGYADEIGLLAVGAALALTGQLRSRANARLFETASAAVETSPQPLPANLVGMGITAEGAKFETRRLLTLSRRAILIAVFWAAVLPLGIIGMIESESAIDKRIEFMLSGFADLMMLVSLLATAFSVFLLPMSLMAGMRWRRKHRSVSRSDSGWRAAWATAKPRYWESHAPPPEVHLRFGDGTEVRAQLPGSTSHGIRLYQDKSDIPVWVGGEATGMVVLFPYGRLSRRRYAVPVGE